VCGFRGVGDLLGLKFGAVCKARGGFRCVSLSIFCLRVWVVFCAFSAAVHGFYFWRYHAHESFPSFSSCFLQRYLLLYLFPHLLLLPTYFFFNLLPSLYLFGLPVSIFQYPPPEAQCHLGPRLFLLPSACTGAPSRLPVLHVSDYS
jgi:hypothetical protein